MVKIGEDVLEYLLKGVAAVNAGPDGREILCNQMEQEYNDGNILHSVFYQVMMLFQAFDLRYAHEAHTEDEESKSVQELRANMNEWEKKDFESNPLLQYAYGVLLAADDASAQHKQTPATESGFKTTNFLYDVRTPTEGLQRIESVCKQMPKEWTVIQLCKGPRPDTTYTIYPKIHESSASIYLTVLHHARTAEYPAHICLRFPPNAVQDEESLFKSFAMIAERFKQNISVNTQQVHSSEFKMKYWQNLQNLEEYISKVLDEFKAFFYPWLFLFTGTPIDDENRNALGFQKKVFDAVDLFCDTHKWKPTERVLLSLTALNVKTLSRLDLEAVCGKLADNAEEVVETLALLHGLQTSDLFAESSRRDKSIPRKHYPTILIVDERLDHFYWEALNVKQEFCRVSSLHCLWRLQQFYKHRIRKGYLMMNVEGGGVILNPDDNLENTEMRMKSFFEYWLPHWKIKCREKLTTENLCNEFFNQNCFVYAGHGSGLQYFNGKQLTQQQMNGVVFLFGCDSSRLRSNGLYSELVGAHRYYHAAFCPAVVGTLLPGLDSNMDAIAARILSQWIPPTSKNVMLWSEVDPRPWKKEGIIKAKSKPTSTVPNMGDYMVGSLCEIISRVHQRIYDKNYYNTIGYVCRGLPVWNCNAQPLPK